jgi:hypothetical protein
VCNLCKKGKKRFFYYAWVENFVELFKNFVRFDSFGLWCLEKNVLEIETRCLVDAFGGCSAGIR